MTRVVVLGGGGVVGQMAARTLAAHDTFDEVVVADLDGAKIDAVVSMLGIPGVCGCRVDVSDEVELKRCLEGCQVVLNCVGPFYQFAVPVLRAALEGGIDYVDVCDDVDATLELLELDAEARDAGVTALIGMGNSPGVTNVLARLAAEHLLDETEAVDIYHCHGGEPTEGAGVIAHRMYGMSIDLPMYLNGKLEHVRFFEPEGLALRTRVAFHLIGDDIPVYPYPHPEQITIPRYLDLKQVTNRGTVLPNEYFELTTELCRLGLNSREPMTVADLEVRPLDFAIAYLQRRREELLMSSGLTSARGCTRVDVRGVRRGRPQAYIFSMASTDQGLGEGTGIPAAMGAILMARGKVEGPGVRPPEGAVAPFDVLRLIQPVLALSGSSGSFQGFLVEKVDENGQVEQIDLPFF